MDRLRSEREVAISNGWLDAYRRAKEAGIKSKTIGWVFENVVLGRQDEDYYLTLYDATRWLEGLTEGVVSFHQK